MADFEEVADRMDDHLREVADLIESDAGPQICEVMRAYAVRKITQQHAVDTGALRNSVSTAQDMIVRNGELSVTMGIECTSDYGLFIEYGTGPNGDPAIPHTSKEKWVYMDTKGRFKTAHSQHPRPFMRPALYDNVNLYKRIIAKEIVEVFSE